MRGDVAAANGSLNQPEYCGAHGLPSKRFGDWRARFQEASARTVKLRRPEGSKQGQLTAILLSAVGSTIAAMADALHWKQHRVRGAIAGAQKKKLRLDVTSEKVEGRRSVYVIPEAT